MASNKWIQGAINPSDRGTLHKALGVPAGKKISGKMLAKAVNSKNAKVRKEAVLARTLKSFKKKGT